MSPRNLCSRREETGGGDEEAIHTIDLPGRGFRVVRDVERWRQMCTLKLLQCVCHHMECPRRCRDLEALGMLVWALQGD